MLIYFRKCFFVYCIYFFEFYKEYLSFFIDIEVIKDKFYIGGIFIGILGKYYLIIFDENCIKLLV